MAQAQTVYRIPPQVMQIANLYEAKIQQLTEQLAEAKASNSQLRQERDQALVDTDRLSQVVIAADEPMQQSFNEIDQLIETNKQLRDELEEVKASNAQLSEAATKTRKTVQTLNRELKQAKDDAHNHARNLAVIRGQFDQLNEDYQQVLTEIYQLNQQYASACNGLENLNDAIVRGNDAYQKLLGENQKLKKHGGPGKKARKEMRETLEKLDSANSTISHLEKENKNLKEKNDRLEEDIKEASASVHDTQQHAETQEILQKMASVIEKTKVKNKRLKEENKRLKKSHNGDIDILAAELESLTEENQKLSAENNELFAECERLTSDLESLTKGDQPSIDSKPDHSRQTSICSITTSVFDARLNSAFAKPQDSKSLALLREKDARISELKEQIENSESFHSAVRKDLTDLQTQYEDLQTAYNKLQQAHDALQQDRDHLHKLSEKQAARLSKSQQPSESLNIDVQQMTLEHQAEIDRLTKDWKKKVKSLQEKAEKLEADAKQFDLACSESKRILEKENAELQAKIQTLNADREKIIRESAGVIDNRDVELKQSIERGKNHRERAASLQDALSDTLAQLRKISEAFGPDIPMDSKDHPIRKATAMFDELKETQQFKELDIGVQTIIVLKISQAFMGINAAVSDIPKLKAQIGTLIDQVNALLNPQDQ